LNIEFQKIMAVKIDKEKCTGCFQCLIICPSVCFTMVDGKAQVDNKECVNCRACQQACETGAITVLPGKAMGGGGY
jgi:NAD-dependent dihydropyrimidine dehydrogenase PreA subunit